MYLAVIVSVLASSAYYLNDETNFMISYYFRDYKQKNTKMMLLRQRRRHRDPRINKYN